VIFCSDALCANLPNIAVRQAGFDGGFQARI